MSHAAIIPGNIGLKFIENGFAGVSDRHMIDGFLGIDRGSSLRGSKSLEI